MSFLQYLKDTRGELRHVAWPTRLQTIVYTVLVALISVAVSLYLGLFDYIFTGGLARFLEVLPAIGPVTEVQQLGTTTPALQLESIGTSTTPASPQGTP